MLYFTALSLMFMSEGLFQCPRFSALFFLRLLLFESNNYQIKNSIDSIYSIAELYQ